MWLRVASHPWAAVRVVQEAMTLWTRLLLESASWRRKAAGLKGEEKRAALAKAAELLESARVVRQGVESTGQAKEAKTWT